MKENFIEFYVKKYSYLNDINKINVSLIPPIVRRRMSLLNKITFSVLNDVFSDEVQNIVFSSQYGEMERLVKIINQYTTEKEVSPNVFSGSVHNYSVGFFLLNMKKLVPYNALSADENSFSNGLLSAIISDYQDVVFCYADVKDDKVCAFALNLSKNLSISSKKCKIVMQSSEVLENNIEKYFDFFDEKINFLETPLYKLERVIE